MSLSEVKSELDVVVFCISSQFVVAADWASSR